MGEVIDLGRMAQEVTPDKVLDVARAANLTDVVVSGTTPEGNVFFATSTMEVAGINWLLDCAKRQLMDSVVIEADENG